MIDTFANHAICDQSSYIRYLFIPKRDPHLVLPLVALNIRDALALVFLLFFYIQLPIRVPIERKSLSAMLKVINIVAKCPSFSNCVSSENTPAALGIRHRKNRNAKCKQQ